MITLAIEASTYAGSVAVLRGDTVVTTRTVAMRGEHEERLMPAVAEALDEAGLTPAATHRMVCGSGPGSFTSLRIAASIAKGLAGGTGRPLFAVPSLLLLVAGAEPPLAPGRYLAVVDAMRGERFAAEVEVLASGGVEPRGGWARIAEGHVQMEARRRGATPVGPGLEPALAPHARGVARLEALLASARPVDLVSWEPEYGRAAEAQVRWEAAHGRPLPSGGA